MQDLTEEANAAVETKRQLEDEVKTLTAPVKGKEQERKLLARELAQEQKKHKSAVRRLDQARKQILESQGNVAEEERTRTRKIQTTEADIASAKEKVDPRQMEKVPSPNGPTTTHAKRFGQNLSKTYFCSKFDNK